MVGLPVFGSSAFGNTSTPIFNNQNNVTGNLFGQSSTMGQTSTFGQSSSVQNRLYPFGNTNNSQNPFNTTQSQPVSSNLFASTPAFATTLSNPGTFGNSQSQVNASPFFGQSSTQTAGNTNLFSLKFEITGDNKTTGTVVKFNPVNGTDSILQNRSTYSVAVRYMCINFMKTYETKSMEELRFEDYQDNRKGLQQGSFTGNNLFNTATTSDGNSMLNSKPVSLQGFGQQSPIFGQSQTNSFGIKNTFGIPTSKNSSSSFPTTLKQFALTTQTTSPILMSNLSSINTFGANNSFGISNPFESKTTNNYINPNKQPFAVSSPNSTTVNYCGTCGQQKNIFVDSKWTQNPFGVTNVTQSQSTVPIPIMLGQNQQTSFFSNNLKIPPTGGIIQPPNNGGFLSGLTTQSNSVPINILSTKAAYNFTSALPQNSAMPVFNSNIPVVNTRLESTQQLPFFSMASSNIYEQIMATTRIYPEIPFSKNDLKLPNKNKRLSTHTQEIRKVLDDDIKISPSKNITVKVRSPIPKYKFVLFKDSVEDSTLEENIFTNLRPRCPRRLFIQKRQKNEISPNNTHVRDENTSGIYNSENEKREIDDKEISQEDNKCESSNPENDSIGEMTLCDVGDKNQNTNDKNDLSETNNLQLDTNPENLEDSVDLIECNENEVQHSIDSQKCHPTGIICTRDDYYTIPSLDELTTMIQPDGRVIVDNFTIGRHGYGHIYFPERFNVAGINIDKDVHFNLKEIVIYDDDDDNKPVFGEQLNRPAIVVLENVYPRDKQTGQLIKDVKRLEEMNFENILRDISQRNNTNFVEYKSENGCWVFQVDHFSKYGI